MGIERFDFKSLRERYPPWLDFIAQLGQSFVMTDHRQTSLAQTLPATVPFVAPERLEERRGATFDARLGANELGFGPAPSALQAMKDALPEIWKYGDPESRALRQAIGARLKIPIQAITIGEGIDGLLGNLVRLYVAPGDPVVMSAGSYPTFAYHVAGHGGALHTVPFAGDYEDPDALLAKAKEVKAKLIYLSNPNNPMGTVHTAQTVQSLIDALPRDCLLILDEAYTEFAPEKTRPAIDIATQNVIRFRTFSKAYGLAGARIGYAIAYPDIAQSFDKIRNHFGVNSLAQTGALAAFNDVSYLEATCEKVAAARDKIAHIAQSAGLTPLPSATNFVAIDCGQDGGFAQQIVSALAEKGVFVRMPGIAPLNRTIRVSVGPDEALQIFEQALSEVLTALR